MKIETIVCGLKMFTSSKYDKEFQKGPQILTNVHQFEIEYGFKTKVGKFPRYVMLSFVVLCFSASDSKTRISMPSMTMTGTLTGTDDVSERGA